MIVLFNVFIAKYSFSLGPLKYDDLEYHKEIGKGSHSTVFCATFKCGRYKSYEEVAVKNLHRQEDEEVEIMTKLRHPNVVTFIDSIKTAPFYVIVMEKCEQSLWKYLEDPSNPLDANQQKKWICQATKALRYLHENDVVHRDLRAKNCLLTKDKTLKIGDFGISKVAGETRDTAHQLGTKPYRAPEVTDESKFSKASDIYALGFLFLEIYTREVPLPIKDHTNLERYLEGKHCIPDHMKDFMCMCWKYDYKQRPTIEELYHKLTSGEASSSSSSPPKKLKL